MHAATGDAVQFGSMHRLCPLFFVYGSRVCLSAYVCNYMYLRNNNNNNLMWTLTNRLFICYCFEAILYGTVGNAGLFRCTVHALKALSVLSWCFSLGCSIIYQNDSSNKNWTYGLFLKTKHNGLLTDTAIQWPLISVFLVKVYDVEN